MRLGFSRPAVIAPKVVMTDLWRQSRIDPRSWTDLLNAQQYADELMELGAYPDDLLDKDLVFLSRFLPPTLASAMLRRRLIRGIATRRYAERKQRLGL